MHAYIQKIIDRNTKIDLKSFNLFYCGLLLLTFILTSILKTKAERN